VSSAEKAQAARQAGADHCIDYKREDVGERVRALTDGTLADCMIELDLSANAKLIPSVLRPKGRAIVYGTGPEATLPAAFCLVNSIGVLFFLVYELDSNERAAALAGIADGLGWLKHRIAQPAFTLHEIATAHEAIERGAVGNVVVTL
jgi:NADPH:quinone reductase